MTVKESERLKCGLYRFFYGPGDKEFSVGAVGRDEAGRTWFAPTNWIAHIPCFDWNYLDRVELLATEDELRRERIAVVKCDANWPSVVRHPYWCKCSGSGRLVK